MTSGMWTRRPSPARLVTGEALIAISDDEFRWDDAPRQFRQHEQLFRDVM